MKSKQCATTRHRVYHASSGIVFIRVDLGYIRITANTSPNYCTIQPKVCLCHDDVIKWKHFPRYWPFVEVIHGSPLNYPQKGQWRGTLIFSLIWTWINGWVNNRDGDLRRQRAHYDVIVMVMVILGSVFIGTETQKTGVIKCTTIETRSEFILLISLRASNTYMHHPIRPSLVQIMACRLFDAK